jgi:hypothetical protein
MKLFYRISKVYFKMIIPMNSFDFEGKSYSNEKENAFITKLIENNSFFNESQIVEKNSKKFYYEIECMILDINRKKK